MTWEMHPTDGDKRVWNDDPTVVLQLIRHGKAVLTKSGAPIANVVRKEPQGVWHVIEHEGETECMGYTPQAATVEYLTSLMEGTRDWPHYTVEVGR